MLFTVEELTSENRFKPSTTPPYVVFSTYILRQLNEYIDSRDVTCSLRDVKMIGRRRRYDFNDAVQLLTRKLCAIVFLFLL